MRSIVAFTFLAASLARPASAADLMPVAQQNALVQKYCAICHTDASRNGGLSLEHFDAAQAPPSLMAMLLSKLSGGALGAAGIKPPSKPIEDALLQAFEAQSGGSTNWNIERSTTLTASMLREGKKDVKGELYRLIASCNPATQQGSLQLAWSPSPQSGSLAASVDGKAAVSFAVEGSETMGNGSALILKGRAAVMLDGLPWPAESLTIRDLFPGDTVTFSFTDLPKDARDVLRACFR